MNGRKSRIRYIADNDLYRAFLGLLAVWPAVGGIVLYSLVREWENYAMGVKVYFLILYPAMEGLFFFLYRLYRSRKRIFEENKNTLIQSGQRAAGRIVEIHRHYRKPDNGGNKKIPSVYYARIEYFDVFCCEYVSRWTEELAGIPYGKEAYEAEASDRYDVHYRPNSSLECVVYYTADGKFFVE